MWWIIGLFVGFFIYCLLFKEVYCVFSLVMGLFIVFMSGVLIFCYGYFFWGGVFSLIGVCVISIAFEQH